MEKNKNYRLKFVKYLKGEYVQYMIRLMTIEDNSVGVEFYERFSTLKDLHEVFKKEANSINFPKFPPKKFFNSTDEKFLNQRQTALEHYFNTILGSKEYSAIPSLRRWVDDMFRRHSKGSHQDSKSSSHPNEKREKSPATKISRSNSNSGDNSNIKGQSFLKNSDLIQRCKDVVDKYSKNFIDLNNDNNPHFEIEDSITKEKNYHNLLKSSNSFDHKNSKFFKLTPGDNIHFECLGLEEPKIAPIEAQMLSKLNAVSKQIVAEIPEEYFIEELILKINLNRN